MSAERGIVSESYEPGNSCNFTWKIQNFDSFRATQQHPAKSSQFSSSNGEVWQLGMYYMGNGAKNIFYRNIYVNIILCSATDIYTNVHVELSTVIDRQKERKNWGVDSAKGRWLSCGTICQFTISVTSWAIWANQNWLSTSASKLGKNNP